MRKEIERLYNDYKNIIKSDEIVLSIEKSDPFDNRSPRCYKIYTRLINDEIICEYGFCKNWKDIVNRFEKKIKEKNIKY